MMTVTMMMIELAFYVLGLGFQKTFRKKTLKSIGNPNI